RERPRSCGSRIGIVSHPIVKTSPNVWEPAVRIDTLSLPVCQSLVRRGTGQPVFPGRTSMTEEAKPAQPAEAVAQQFQVDTSNLSTVYANFCRVTGTPEELVLDF